MAAAARQINASVASLYPGSDKFYNPLVGKGKILFTGPDGISDQTVTIIDPTYVGIGTMSPEGTSDLNYLWRPGHRCRAFPPAKSKKVGEIGWGINLFNDIKRLKSGEQIMRGEFRQECEDRHTHLYQNPWYPHPKNKEAKRKSEKDEDTLFISSEKGRRDMTEGRYSSRVQSPGHFRSYTPVPRRSSPLYDDPAMVRDISEGHNTRGYSPRQFRSHTPTPSRSPSLYESPGIARPPPRPRSCTPASSRNRSGTMSSTTSRHSQLYS